MGQHNEFTHLIPMQIYRYFSNKTTTPIGASTDTAWVHYPQQRLVFNNIEGLEPGTELCAIGWTEWRLWLMLRLGLMIRLRAISPLRGHHTLSNRSRFCCGRGGLSGCCCRFNSPICCSFSRLGGRSYNLRARSLGIRNLSG